MTHTLSEIPPPCYLLSHGCGDRTGTVRIPAAPATRQQEPPAPNGGPLQRGASVSGMTSLPGMVAL